MQKKKSYSIRGQRRAQARFKKTIEQTLFARLFEVAADGNFLVDHAGKILIANRRAAELFGYPRQALSMRAFQALFREEQRQHLNEQLDEVVKKAAAKIDLHSTLAGLIAQRKDGQNFPADVILYPLPEVPEAAALCVVRDISRQVERERRLRKQAELVQFLQDVAVAANEAESVSSALQFSVDRLARLLGWPVGHAYIADDNESVSPTSIWAGAVEERYLVFKAVSEALQFNVGSGLIGWVLETRQPIWIDNLFEHENYARRKEARDAGLRSGLILPIIAGKRVVGVLEFYTDQTVPPDPELLAILPHAGIQIGRLIERKQAENTLRQQTAELRLVVTNLPVIILMINREGSLLLMEGKGLQDTTLQPEVLIGRNIFEQLNGRPDLLELFRRGLNGEEIQTDVVSNTGAIFESFFVPYYDGNWNVDGLIGLSIDITRRKQLEAELEEMKHRLLESSDKERARLGKQLHDGPLQDLYGAFYQLQEAQISVDGQAQETINRAIQTVQNVTATLRMICGELHPNALVHLGLQRAILGHAGRLQDQQDGAVLHLDLDDDSPTSGSALSTQVRLGLFRIYQQLISNAVKHANARHVWVRLKLLPDRVTLEVQDNGAGFQLPEHWIELVRHNQYGLVSALERAQSLGGTLEVRSHPGAGSLVRVVIPRA